MPKLTKMSALAVAVQLKPLMLAASGGVVLIRDKANVTLAALPITKVVIVENELRCQLGDKEAIRKGEAENYSVCTAEGKELWTSAVDTENANMIVRTTSFIPGVLVQCDEFVHTLPYESAD